MGEGAGLPTPNPSRPREGSFAWSGPLRVFKEPGSDSRSFFVSIEGDAAAELAGRVALRRIELGRKPDGGGVKLAVTLGATMWQTQVMPQPGGAWVVPVKVAVLRAEGLEGADQVSLVLDI